MRVQMCEGCKQKLFSSLFRWRGLRLPTLPHTPTKIAVGFEIIVDFSGLFCALQPCEAGVLVDSLFGVLSLTCLSLHKKAHEYNNIPSSNTEISSLHTTHGGQDHKSPAELDGCNETREAAQTKKYNTLSSSSTRTRRRQG